MNILFTICGRAGSKGIPSKNIRDFLGIPLPLYTLSAIDIYLKNNDVNSDIVLSTDSPELIGIMQNNKLQPINIIERAENLSGDSISKFDVIKNCHNIMKERNSCDYDLVIDLDITAPLRKAEDLQNMINAYINAPSDVMFSVTEARRSPYFNMVKKTSKGYVRIIESDYSARQQVPEVFDMNASIYIFSADFLVKNDSIFQGVCDIYKMEDTGVLDLDHKNDFELMEVIGEYLYKKYNEFGMIKDNIVL